MIIRFLLTRKINGDRVLHNKRYNRKIPKKVNLAIPDFRLESEQIVQNNLQGDR